MLSIYRFFLNLFYPLIIAFIYFRIFLNKEDKNRFKEKLFASSFNTIRNYKKKLIWFHVASIGEFKSIKPLIKELNKKNKFEFLITTVTLSSAKLVQENFNNQSNVFHRFFPIDKLSLVNNFLDSWQPSLSVFVDSEIWPNFLLSIKRRNIKLVLLNARITKKTYFKWKIISKTAYKIFSSFDLCIPSSNESKKYLEKLKVRNIEYFGNLKLTTKNDKNLIANSNKKILERKNFWCAVSIHEGEDIFCIKTHLILKKNNFRPTAIIIPRHINKSKNIKKNCEKFNLKAQIISKNDIINPDNDIIIVNSYGLISSYLELCKSVFIGKSTIKKMKDVGGQDPIEAAKSGCKIYHGPYVYNFYEIYKLLSKLNLSEEVKTEIHLAKKIYKDLKSLKNVKSKKISIINNLGKKILKDTCDELYKIIKK